MTDPSPMAPQPGPGTPPPPPPSPQDLVLDASVAIKWYVPEVHTAEAGRFMSPVYAMQVPSFFAAECGNTIWKKVAQRHELTPQEGQDVLDELLSYPRQVHDAEVLTPLALALALEVGNAKLAVYDFIYLALALELDCRLVTADGVFHGALKGGRYGPTLLWVADPL
jgi:predicted nucleic acid-binding protein